MKKLIIIVPRRKLRIYLSILAILPILVFAASSSLLSLKLHGFPVLSFTSQNKIDLIQAYTENDSESVKQFFENWNEESKKQTKTEYKNDLDESLYKIFKVVYHPYNMDRLVREPMMGFFEQDLIAAINRAPYLVIQNKISYIIRNLDETEGKDLIDYIISVRIERDDIKTLEDFFPSVEEDPEKILYLTKQYEDELTNFLGTEDQPFGKKHIMAPSVPKGETGKRYEFIRNYIPVLYGHWGGYWHLSTHPEILYIFINPELNHALAHYRIGYNFGYAELKKEDGNWIFVRANMNGIE